MKKIGIVEDEVLIAYSLEENLEKLGFATAGPAMDYEEALAMIVSERPDLVLLDIRLKGKKSGIDVAYYILENHDLPFVFLTSHLDRDTFDAAKDTGPAGYLTKPFHISSLYTTIGVALHNFEKKEKDHRVITLKSGFENERVAIDDILYLKSDHVYIEVVLKDRSLLVRQSMNDILALLPADSFFQVHRSYAVNIRHVVSFGSSKVVLSGIEVPISRTYRDEFRNRFQSE